MATLLTIKIKRNTHIYLVGAEVNPSSSLHYLISKPSKSHSSGFSAKNHYPISLSTIQIGKQHMQINGIILYVKHAHAKGDEEKVDNSKDR